MTMGKKLPALLLCTVLLFALSVTAYAHETPDMTETGSVSVSMVYGGEAVPGGTLTLYQVGEIQEENGDYSFVLTGDFVESGADLSDISSAELPEKLWAFAAGKGLAGTAVEIGADGKASVDGLSLGLYLVVQTGAAEGFEAAAPFLVSIPMYEGGAYVYNVDASPKMGTLTETEATPTPTPTPSAKPTAPGGPTLPQTGQLNWPVPVLAVLGLCLLLVGWGLRYGKKEQPDEA